MRVDGLIDFIRDIENAEMKTTVLMEACVVKIGARLLRSVKLKTPVAKSTPTHTGGQLRRNWRFVRSGQFEGIIENCTEYAGYVEYGHRTRSGSVVDGRYMLKSSIEEVENIIGQELGFIIDNIL